MPRLISNYKWRHYRVRIKKANGKDIWIKINTKIYSKFHLKKELDKIYPVPTDVYQSVSWWLIPEHLGAKSNRKGYPILDNFFLGSDYIMDFDLRDYAGINDIFKNIQLAKIELNNLNMYNLKFIKTGRGYQLLNQDFNKWANVHVTHPRDREKAYQDKMIKLTNILLSRKIKWDSDVSRDTRRIFRVINTRHFNGEIIKLINAGEINEIN